MNKCESGTLAGPGPRIEARFRWLCLITALLGLGAGKAMAAPRVVVSIAPIHSLVAGVMQGVGEPHLIVKRYATPHSFQMRPSDAAKLNEADVIFWVGRAMEVFLVRPLAALEARVRVVELMALDGLSLLANREGGVWDVRTGRGGSSGSDTVADSQSSAHARHLDVHLWLDAANAKRIVDAIARVMSIVDPPNSATYARNAEALITRIDSMDEAMAARLAPLRDEPFIVFHDAYQYLERRYRLRAVGTVLVRPDQLPSAKRIRELRIRIELTGAQCLFHEPQFNAALAQTLIEGSTAHTDTLDPIGTSLAAGPDAYFELMRGLADGLVRCLKR